MEYGTEERPTRAPRIRELLPSERPVYRLHQVGPAALSDAELLSILIQATSLAAAQELLIHFDGWSGLLQASAVELQQGLGIGPHRAAQIRAALEVGRRLLISSPDERQRVRSPADAASLLLIEMGHLDHEQFRTVLLDTKHHVQAIHTVYVGSLNTALIRVGEVFKEAIRRNSAAMILAHNHPSSDTSPSSEDLLVTREIVAAGKLLDIDVLDHLIIGRGRFVSLREQHRTTFEH